jgi:hypothetical protein
VAEHRSDAWLAEIQRQNPGLWVAIHDGVVIAASRTPYDLHAQLHQREMPNATIVRCPDVNEPELVGLG